MDSPGSDDVLFPVRERFYISSFAAALQVASNIKPASDLLATELRALQARCWLATGKYSNLKELKDSPDLGLKSVATFAMFVKAKDPAAKQKAFECLLELGKGGDGNALYLAACAYEGGKGEGDLFQVVEAIHMLGAAKGGSTELAALRGQLLLLINQRDMAVQAMKGVNSTNDEVCIAKMISAMVHCCTGNFQEAFLLYCDIEAVYGDDLVNSPSLAILNGKGCANLLRGCWSEAEEDLLKAFQCASNDADTLVNLCALSVHKGESENLDKYLSHLSKYAPDHAVCRKLAHLETSFKNFVA